MFESLFSSTPIWGLCDILFTLMVLVGVCGESIWLQRILIPEKPNDLLPVESKRKKLGKKFELLLIVGIAGELICIPFSLWESAELNKEAEAAKQIAGEANERASTNALAAKQLEIQLNETKTQLANAEARLNQSVVELKNDNLPMDIGEQYSFANALKPLSGMQVELRSAVDTKAQKTTELLFSTFVMAGWPVINRAFIGDIGENGIVIGYGNDDSSKNAAYLLLKILTERDVPSKIIEDPMGGSCSRGSHECDHRCCLPTPKSIESQFNAGRGKTSRTEKSRT